VRWILKEKSRTNEFSAPSGGGSPESIRDDVTATSSDLSDVGFNVSSIQIDDAVGVEVDSDFSDEKDGTDESD
jgi:hypothetical protein